MQTVITVGIAVGMVLGGTQLLGHGIDRSIDSQNVMLCESAKGEMGDPGYYKQCQPYYESGDITYMRAL